MSLINQIARIMFIRKNQYDLGADYTMTKGAFAPGPLWKHEYENWNNLDENEKLEWMSAAENWCLALQENSPITYAYINNHFRNSLVTEETLDTL